MSLLKMGINFVDVEASSWQPAVMLLRTARILDAPSAEYVKGLALDAEGEEAIRLLEAARFLDPHNLSIVSHLAVNLLDGNRFAEVADLVTSGLKLTPRDPHLLNMLGVALFRLENYQAASQLFQFCLEVDAEYPNATESLARAKSRFSQSLPVDPAMAMTIDNLLREGRKRPKATLSVCMIVKNESEFIEDAILSVNTIADEVIVVDTGSSDDTVELALRHGARVEHFQWVGDFAKARNASLDYATGDWILVLDADERLRPESRVNLRAVMESRFADAEPTVFCVQIKNYTRDGVFQNDGFSGRLFRNDPRLRFEGKVHEEVGRAFGTDYRLDIAFDHFGADPEIMQEKGKDQRNLDLLALKLAEDPDDLVTWFYLASQHWTGSRTTAAFEAFHQVTKLYEQDPSVYGMAIVHIPVAYSYVGLIRTQMQLAKFEDAALSADKGIALLENNPDLLFQAGLAYLYTERWTDAVKAFEDCLSTPISGFGRIGMHDPSIQEWRAEKMLGDAYFANAEMDKAFAAYHKVYERVPTTDADYIVMLARLVELASTLNRADDLREYALAYLVRRPTEIDVALQVAQQLTKQDNGIAASLNFLEQVQAGIPSAVESLDFVLLVGQLLQAAEDTANAIQWYLQAADLGEDSPSFWLNLGQLLMQVEELDAAQQAFDRAKLNLGAEG